MLLSLSPYICVTSMLSSPVKKILVLVAVLPVFACWQLSHPSLKYIHADLSADLPKIPFVFVGEEIEKVLDADKKLQALMQAPILSSRKRRLLCSIMARS